MSSPLTTMIPEPFPEMTLRAAAAVPPTRRPAPLPARMAVPLSIASVPVASVPNRFPAMSVSVAPERSTPMMLPEMTLPAPAPVPPIVFPLPPAS